MKVIRKVKTDNTKEVLRRAKDLNENKIRIGIFGEDDSFLLMVGTVNEFGQTIKPKSSKYLTIPLNKKAKKKKASEFSDLYVLEAKSGELYLVRDKGKNDIEFMYWLAKSVEIPERSFIRGSYEDNKAEIQKYVEYQIGQYLNLKIDKEVFWNRIGEKLVSITKRYMTDLKDPPNSSATLASKAPKNNPLIDTGRLRNAIVWKVDK